MGKRWGKALFRNLYYFSAEFRNHNWNDFFGDLRQDQEPYIEAELRKSYADPRRGGPEPYFYSIFPATMSAAACASFLRHTTLPITERDYYLSKLFQFLYVPLELKFLLPDNETDVCERLEEFLV